MNWRDMIFCRCFQQMWINMFYVVLPAETLPLHSIHIFTKTRPVQTTFNTRAFYKKRFFFGFGSIACFRQILFTYLYKVWTYPIWFFFCRCFQQTCVIMHKSYVMFLDTWERLVCRFLSNIEFCSVLGCSSISCPFWTNKCYPLTAHSIS